MSDDLTPETQARPEAAQAFLPLSSASNHLRLPACNSFIQIQQQIAEE
jgi:hypothetical protein